MKKNQRNYLLILADPILFISAMAFISLNVVVPNFLNNLGASAFQISFASALCSIGPFISQPIFAQYAMGLSLKSNPFSKILLTQRFMFLAYVITIPLINQYISHLSIPVFLVFWGAYNVFVGAYSPFYMSVLSKVIPGNQRGRIQGFAGALGNLLGLGSAFIVGLLLRRIPFPLNYTWILGIGTVILIADAGIFLLIEEKPDKAEKQEINYFKYLREIPHALKGHKEYSSAVLGNCFLVISNVALSFYTLAAIRNFNSGPEQIALFTGIGILVNVFGNLVFGIMGDRIGHRYVLLTNALLSVLASVTVLSFHSIYAVYIGFALSSLSAGGYNISYGVNIINHSPKGTVPLFISINIMITLVAASLVTLIAGAVIDLFSFTPLFIFTGICGVISMLIFYHANDNFGL